MVYLQPSEYSAYGLEENTPAALVAAASALIERHCRRPSLAVASYTERLRLSRGASSVRLTYLPLAPLAPATSAMVSARLRYGLPRRGELPGMELAHDVSAAFGLPGGWTNLDVETLDVIASTGEVGFAANPIGLPFNEIEITYTAGLDPIPDAVKFACAQLVRNGQATPALNVRAGQLDKLQMEYFGDSLVDSTVRTLLAP